ncbi:MAG TPA: cyclic nucleotide-binding domain-containing protein [Aeromicrobium sp.]|nr:cyclic nucleotide-binding domain-containing protein [Aeromicrobium sp.]
MSFFRKSPHEWLAAEVIAARPEVEQRLIDQMLNGKLPPTVREWDAGTNLFKQGFFAQAVHLVLAGEVVVTVDDDEVARLGPGSVIGEMAMLGKRRRTGTVTAVLPTTIASIGESKVDREDLRALAAARGLTTSDD